LSPVCSTSFLSGAERKLPSVALAKEGDEPDSPPQAKNARRSLGEGGLLRPAVYGDVLGYRQKTKSARCMNDFHRLILARGKFEGAFVGASRRQKIPQPVNWLAAP